MATNLIQTELTSTAFAVYRAINAEVYLLKTGKVNIVLDDGTRIHLENAIKTNKLAKAILSSAGVVIIKNMPHAIFDNNPVKVRQVDPRNGRRWSAETSSNERQSNDQ